MKFLVKVATVASLVAVSSFGSNLLEVYKSPTCGCCSKWEAVMQKDGFETIEYKVQDTVALKKKFNVPLELSSCHTAIISGYVVEGHVPAAEIKKLLEIKPEGVIGISAPGMPLESPGMEQGSEPDKYDIVLFKQDGTREIFATYIGSKKIQ